MSAQVLRDALRRLANALREQGKINESEDYIDATFASGKGATGAVAFNGVRADLPRMLDRLAARGFGWRAVPWRLSLSAMRWHSRRLPCRLKLLPRTRLCFRQLAKLPGRVPVALAKRWAPISRPMCFCFSPVAIAALRLMSDPAFGRYARRSAVLPSAAYLRRR